MPDLELPEGITHAEAAAYEAMRTNPARRPETLVETDRLYEKRRARRLAEEAAGIRTAGVKTEDGV